METNNKRNKSIPIVEIMGAIAVVSLLCIQLFWRKETNPEFRQLIEIISMVAVAISAILLILNAKNKRNKDKLTLRPVEDNDISQIETWLTKPHILKWYHEPQEWLLEINERNGSFNFLNHFIVLKDDKPIGFGQYYDCFDSQEECYSITKPNEAFSIDYFIGEEDCLRKGFGTEIVKLLTEKILDQNPNAEILVQPENDNIASCKALLVNGYRYNKEKNYFQVKQIK